MNKKILIILIVCCIQTLISGCKGNMDMASTSEDEFVENTPDFQAENTNAPEINENCWEPEWQEVWVGKHQLVTMAEGPDNDFWFLTTDTLDRASAVNDNYQYNSLSYKLPCEDCTNSLNLSLVISNTGEAWVELDSGLFIFDKNENWRIISSEEIMPDLLDYNGIHVLLSDDDGNIWVAIRDNLCSYNGKEWHCNQLEGLHRTYTRDNVEHQGLANILSAVSGREHEIWFGAKDGIILKFDGEKFEFFEIAELIPEPMLNPRFGSLAYDHTTNTLWALNSYAPRGEESVGVYRRNEDESWQIYNKDLFISRVADSQSLYIHSISVTNDGKVWVGMVFGLSLAYYDGLEWRTFDGEILPLDSNDITGSGYRFTVKNECNTPGSYISDILSTKDGNLLVGDVGAAYIYQP